MPFLAVIESWDKLYSILGKCVFLWSSEQLMGQAITLNLWRKKRVEIIIAYLNFVPENDKSVDTGLFW